jgi:hypothetical protein
MPARARSKAKSVKRKPTRVRSAGAPRRESRGNGQERGLLARLKEGAVICAEG